MSTTRKLSRNERARTLETRLFRAAEAACRRASLRQARRLLERVVRLRGQLRAQAKIYLEAIRLFANAEAAYEQRAFARSHLLFGRAAIRCSPLRARARRYLAQSRLIRRRELRARGGGAAFGSDSVLRGARITPGKKAKGKREGPGKPTKEKKAKPKTVTKQAKGPEKAGRPSKTVQPPIALPTVAKDTIVRRTPHMDLSLDRAVQRGDEFGVRVYLDTSPPRVGEQSDDVVIRALGDTPVLALEVWLACTPHFEIAGLRIQPLTLRLSGSARQGENSAVFSVRVKPALADVGGAFLTAYFFYNGRSSGKVTREIAIVAGEETRPTGSQPTRRAIPTPANYSAMELNATAVSPDLTVEITDPERNLQRLRCRVSSSVLMEKAAQLPGRRKKRRSAADPMDWLLPQHTGDLVAELMREFVGPGIDARQRLLRLKGAGRMLFDTAPEAFKRLLWRLIDARKPPKTIYIVSEDPYIPWELMIPNRRRPDGSNEERPPLGVEFTVGRWIPADYLSPGQRFSLKKGFVIAPVYPGPRPKPLAFAADETAFVCAQAESGEILPIEPCDLYTIDTRLSAQQVSLLHFICHGAQASHIGLQRIFLAGTSGVQPPTLSSIEIGQMEGFKTACQGKPLVFLNACEVGRITPALAGVGGFAKAFIDLGASGVVAPLWSVKDELAHEVAKAFYTRLKGKSSRFPVWRVTGRAVHRDPTLRRGHDGRSDPAASHRSTPTRSR